MLIIIFVNGFSPIGPSVNYHFNEVGILDKDYHHSFFVKCDLKSAPFKPHHLVDWKETMKSEFSFLLKGTSTLTTE